MEQVPGLGFGTDLHKKYTVLHFALQNARFATKCTFEEMQTILDLLHALQTHK